MSILIGLFWLFTWTTAVLVGTAFYPLPTGIAFARKAPDPALIAVINIAFGATGIGWLIALALALACRIPANSHTNAAITVINQANPPIDRASLPPTPPAPSTGPAPHPEALRPRQPNLRPARQ